MLNLSRKVLCLDWDKRSLRIVAARVGAGKMALEDAHSHRLPHTVDADEPQAMGDFIQQMLRRHHLRSKWVLVDVPRERAVINRLTLPPTPASEVAAAVQFQAMRELPFPFDSAAVDYVVTRRDEQGAVIEVLLAAVTLETLERVRATCQAAGLTPARIGLRPYANLVSARHVLGLEGRRVLFADVGPGATEIDVFHGDALAFARSANVTVPVPTGEPGGREDSRIISLAEIADLEGSTGAIEAAVNELMVEVTRTLQAYRATEPDTTIDAIVVAGGTGIETQFAEALERRLSVPTQLFDPTGPLGIGSGEASKLCSFSASLGLAWGLSREGLLALDFLNPKRPVSSRETLRRRARVGTLAAAVVLVAAGGVYGRYYYGLKSQYDALRKSNAGLAEKLEERRAIQRQVEAAQSWAVDAVWPDELLSVTQAAVEPGKKMLVQRIDMDCTRREQRIVLGGLHAADYQVPSEFVQHLNDVLVGGHPRFSAVYQDWAGLNDLPGFGGKTDVQVELTQVQQQMAEYEKRAKRSKGAK